MIWRSMHSIALALLLLGGASVFAATTSAGPVTGGTGAAPFVKVGVYQGVISIVPGGPTTGVLEIGADGKDIASNTDIVIRPNSLSRTAGAVLTTTSSLPNSKTRLKVPGRIYLYPGGVQEWHDAFPSGGGAQFWDLASDESFLVVQPISNTTISIGTSASPISNRAGLDITGFSPNQAIAASTANALGYAIELQGNLRVEYSTNVGGTIRVNGSEIWHANNDGENSLLDADLLDGVQATIENGSSCGSMVCLCFQMPAGKRCAQMNNHI